ncbi:MAG: hypothetical protein K6G28_01750 [Acholeplasmatales bacterium]|nr:hypothetical protein [Acholeplasmatales bacterium]
MKNKLKIFTVLSAFGCAAALGLAAANSTPIYASPMPIQHLLMANGEVNTESQYIRKVPESWVEQGTVEYGGLKYTVTSNRGLYAYEVDNPAEVRELILYYHFGRTSVGYGTIDWSKYTGLQNVIVVANDMSFCKEYLAALPSGVNLYISGGLNFGTALETMPFENIYLCNIYSQGINTISDRSFTNNLASSNLKHIYYNDYYESHNSYSINEFTTKAYTNKNGETITIGKATNIPYPKEVFYPFEKYDETSSVLGGKSRFYASSSGQVTSMNSLTESVEEIDDRVVDLALNSIGDGNDLDRNHTYRKLYFKNLKSYNFSVCKADEVIFAPAYSNYGSTTPLTLEYFGNIKTIRILPSSRAAITFSGNISQGSSLKKILIPASETEKYATALAQTNLQGVIETYDDSAYVVPYSSYKTEDDKIINVAYSTTTIEDAEYMRSCLDAIHIDYTDKAVDVLASKYELPNKETYDENVYSIRSYSTIVVPKNINAKDVLNMAKDILVTNNGRTCDPEGFTIKSIDESEYTFGYNGKLTFTVQYPDGTEESFASNVRVMNVDGNYGYIMDSTKGIIVVGPHTSGNKQLSVLLEPLMENYLMETNVEYDTSEILDTSSPTFNCANSYKASASQGKVRVWLTNDSLVEEKPTQGGNETPSQSEEPTNNETPTQTTDTDDVDTEGYEILNITKIYTTSTIDGSKLLAGLRDDLLTKDGEPKEISFAIGYNNHTNLEPWSFSAYGRITSTDKYRKTINVEIIEHSLNMGFVMFEDGTVAVEYNTYEHYTPKQIKDGIVEFFRLKNLDTESITIPESFNRNGVFYGTYFGGKIILVDSGYNLAYTTSTQPTDETKEKEGYKGLHTIYYTEDFTIEEALRSVSRHFILKDGEPVENYSIEFTTKENSRYVDFIIKDGETKLLDGSVVLQKIESDYSYVFGRMYDFDYGYLVMKKADKAPEYKLNDVIKDALSHFRGLLSPFDNEATVDFTKVESKEVKGVYQVGNGAYYSYEFDCDVVDLDHVVRTNECTVDGNAQTGETFVDKVNDFFGDVKTKFEENKAFKVGAIALGSITGLLLLYGFYILIRKMFKWFKK